MRKAHETGPESTTGDIPHLSSGAAVYHLREDFHNELRGIYFLLLSLTRTCTTAHPTSTSTWWSRRSSISWITAAADSMPSMVRRVTPEPSPLRTKVT